MARNDQVARIYNILLILEYAPHGITVRGLCERLNERGHGAGVRTVYRDLNALRKAGFPLHEKGTDADNATRWILERKTNVTKAVPLTNDESAILSQFCQVLKTQVPAEKQAVVIGLLGKIASQLGADRRFSLSA
jgi:predicted DNA-binding transcriptional regulator YafY